MLGIHVVIVAVLGFAISGTRADLPKPNVATFDVDGIAALVGTLRPDIVEVEDK